MMKTFILLWMSFKMPVLMITNASLRVKLWNYILYYKEKNGGWGGDLTKRQKYDIIPSETDKQYKMNVVCFDDCRGGGQP
jgi:hypothetical protein